MSNASMIHQVHAGANVSDKGTRQSHGAMVKYLYDLTKVSQNHENYANAGTVAASPDIRSLAALGRKLLPEGAGS